MKYYIGIDLGGTNVRTLLVDETGAVHSEVKGDTEATKGPEYVYEKICGQIDALDLTDCGGSLAGVEGIGIGVPGPVDTVNKVMVMATNLPGFENYQICHKLQAKYNIQAFIDNDAKVAGLAEAVLGAGKGCPIVYYTTVSTGIGGALVVDGKLVSGGRGHAGEIGNIIVNTNGKKINHLNVGAVENEASGTFVTKKGKERIGEDKVAHAGDVFRLAAEGNEVAQGIVDEFIDFLSTMYANIAHVVDPYVFVVGGGVMKSKEYFWDRLVAAFNSKIHVGMQGHIKFVQAELADCGAIGAAMLPMSQLK